MIQVRAITNYWCLPGAGAGADRIEEVTRFQVHNFGCRASQADGGALETALAAKGLEAAGSNDADIVVLNTCTVTATADDDVRQKTRRVHRENPAARILVTGCYERSPFLVIQ